MSARPTAAPDDGTARRVLDGLALTLASVAVLRGAFTVGAWAFDSKGLARPVFGQTALTRNTGACLLLLAVAVMACTGRGRTARAVAVATAVLAGLLAAATALASDGDDLGLDARLAGDRPGELSALSAVVLVCLAVAVLALCTPLRSRVRALIVLALTTVALVPLIGYLYGAQQFSDAGTNTSVPFGAALNTGLLAIAVLALAAPPRVRALLVRHDRAGARIRVALVAAPLLVVVAGLVLARSVGDHGGDAAVVQGAWALIVLSGLALAVGLVADRLESEGQARREAQAQADLAMRRLAAIVDEAPSLVYVRAADGRIVLVNRGVRELLGLGPDALPTDEALFGEDGARIRSVDLAVLESGSGGERSENLRPGGGPVRTYREIRFPIPEGPDGLALCVSITDTSERAQLEVRLVEAERLEAIAAVARGVAHDFRNIITVINGAAELALLGTDDPALQRDLHDILDAGGRGATLARQLLAFGRQGEADPRPLDVGTVVTEMEGLLRHAAGPGVELLVRSSEDLPPVTLDRGALEQAVLQLVANARHALPSGGKVRVEVGLARIPVPATPSADGVHPGTYVRVSVADTGVGMTPEVRARAFEPFFTTRTDHQAAGLGLSGVQAMVQQAGGHVDLSSQLGLGTLIHLYLPAGAIEPGPAETAGRAGAHPVRRARLLVVEDDEAVRTITVRVLHSAGLELVEAEDADDALAALRGSGSHFDLLVTDLVMPDMSGVDLAERARVLAPDLAVLVISGHTAELIEPELRDRLHDRFVALEKPFTRERLLAAVDAALPG